jgi:repressor LexA
VAVPAVGQVAAGTPLLAQENIEDYLPLPAEFLRDAEGFILRVRGESMIDAGIYDGDYLIVRRQQTAANGDIVVARLEDEATVKRFYREAEHIRLQPENPTMDPIRARDVHIEGKVVGLIRRMVS